MNSPSVEVLAVVLSLRVLLESATALRRRASLSQLNIQSPAQLTLDLGEFHATP
jgi:hypothetical protein